MVRQLFFGVITSLILCVTLSADDAIFSGPQVGETLPPLTVRGVFDDAAGKEINLTEQAEGGPLLLVFVHARTRPAFGLTNALMKYAETRAKDGLHSGVIFLAEDATETEKWLQNVRRHFADGVFHGISPDGLEGPGSYGLNRNVTLTVLVGKDEKVTANFALVQPSIQADTPKILKAIVDVAGGEAPSVEQLAGGRYADRAMMQARANDPRLNSLLRAVINKQATEEEVKSAAGKVDKYIAENEAAKRQLGRIASTIVQSGKLSNYGNEASQKTIQRWAKELGSSRDEPGGRERNDEAKDD